MKKVTGITEPYWTTLSEDQRLYWKYGSRLIAVMFSFFIVKTGNQYFDWAMMAITAIFLVITIETQRSYSKLSPRLRKTSIRIAIYLGSSALTLLGLAFFLQAAVSAIFSVFTHHVLTDIAQARHEATKYIILITFLVSAPIAILRVTRQLQLKEYIYDLPRKGLKALFVRKTFRATNFSQFAHVELSLLGASCLYTSTLAAIVNVFAPLFSSAG